MARPKSFDEDRALDAAMHAFWANGYHATSTQDLCAATGLGRSSVYHAFVSKHELFTRALTRYVESMTAGHLAILEDDSRSAVDRVRALLAFVVDGEQAHRRDGRGLGCLSVNTVVELGGDDAVVARLLDRDRERRHAALRAVVERGQRDGEFRTGQDPAHLVRFLDSVVAGMRVASQGGADRADLEGVAATALSALTG
ncbi:TetR/AcrR family transcriptional regulator [Actinosynnema sp. NPDC047251]|uniref:Transcriptional regulator, TetR family n=1 Tax=Saccharothrix espanaensis (strain ATCC 51144 / DSM 44229 / JCM 9112 / NBRC 15066 / NRRL 15764) TaxID=1179773 RepID=K0JYA9_SACES|nr:TetR/AcrR family transcriptional regulator [Saccharothrix espanaensis]CCH31101.1 Transcriptional regulator, TetR family [Saccharothrix espanaensis DSM 44229]